MNSQTSVKVKFEKCLFVNGERNYSTEILLITHRNLSYLSLKKNCAVQWFAVAKGFSVGLETCHCVQLRLTIYTPMPMISLFSPAPNSLCTYASSICNLDILYQIGITSLDKYFVRVSVSIRYPRLFQLAASYNYYRYSSKCRQHFSLGAVKRSRAALKKSVDDNVVAKRAQCM